MRHTQFLPRMPILSHRPVPHLSGHVYKALQCPSRNSAQYPPRYSHCLYQRFPFLSFRQHLPEQLCFRPVKILPHRLHSPYITEKPARKVPFLNTTILIESRCVSISRSIFVSGAISCSATFSIAPDSISNSDSTTAI